MKRKEWEPVASVARVLGEGDNVFVSGLCGSAAPFFVARLAEKREGSLLVVTRGAKEERDFFDDLRTFSSRPVHLFPSRETLPGEGREHPDIVEARFRVLDMLLRGAIDGILVSSVKALLQKLPPGGLLSASSMHIEVGTRLDLKGAISRLTALGYEREAAVYERGQLSVRGGILDVFPGSAPSPIRVELDGDVVASVRLFDPADQRSRSTVKEFTVMVLDELACGGKSVSLIDYLPSPSLVCLAGPAGIKEAALGPGAGCGDLFTFGHLIEKAGSFGLVYMSDVGEEIEEAGEARRVRAGSRSAELLDGPGVLPGVKAEFWRGAFERIAGWVEEGYRVRVYCNNEGERSRLLELVGERAKLLGSVEIGSVASSFLVPEMKLVFISDSEIFGRYKIRRPVERRARQRPFGEVSSEFEPGEYVIHVGQGIGRYIGLRKLKREGAEREYLAIEYRGSSKLYVPVEQAHLVERYVGLGSRRPTLDVLGSGRWTRRKAGVERAIVDFAAGLLELQAIRSSLRGISYSPDTPWQREFEASFIYEETPDQEKAIEEVKADMESECPMDRLICGDVGYGKTEVAIRAAFKAVMDGKQVAVLVPTTVLAQQHFTTFTDRLADYPVEVRALSRFQSPKEQEEAIEGLIAGKVDIVIGTHRLLQSDVLFNDLGLVVIDEEQRFGVGHKERLKRLRKLVDVLTMTATPIPRTLYLSITGLRDMSVIDTPPRDRLAVHTEIIHHDEKTVRDAILRELAREGQVYYVHNRVATIGRVAKGIERLVPEARVAVAHGQMGEGLLEETMRRFFTGEVDVLACTTIIESGLDIPNVNTIFIDAAHRFGLADLYQLRGRVGRYKHRAFAYLIIPRGPIGDEGRRRLRAIAEHSELGAGFGIAMRDLEIRGAGNVLGSEQHGHIMAVGFDLYCRLLKDAIAGLEGRKVRPRYEVSLNIGFYPCIPPDYVPAGRIRIDIYRRVGGAGSPDGIDAMGDEMGDRFGPLPDEARRYLLLAKLKLRAWQACVRSIELVNNRLFIDVPGERIIEKVKKRSFTEVSRAINKVLKGLEQGAIVQSPGETAGSN
ncbi:MAG: transcription-repair coupling factor [Candidatus Tritonobacter lacicola]|nr:transcription-repair coupling factor [Candidatus Tritonobacter lacicola]